MFSLDPSKDILEDPEFHRFKGFILMQFARYVTESEKPSYCQFLSSLREKARVPHNLVPLQNEAHVLRAVARVMGWPIHKHYIVNKAEELNTAGCLLHPRVLAGLFNILPAWAQKAVGNCTYIPRKSFSEDEVNRMNSWFWLKAKPGAETTPATPKEKMENRSEKSETPAVSAISLEEAFVT